MTGGGFLGQMANSNQNQDEKILISRTEINIERNQKQESANHAKNKKIFLRFCSGYEILN
jgi:hypothetical protein